MPTLSPSCRISLKENLNIGFENPHPSYYMLQLLGCIVASKVLHSVTCLTDSEHEIKDQLNNSTLVPYNWMNATKSEQKYMV